MSDSTAIDLYYEVDITDDNIDEVIYEYIEFQFIYKVPSAILASGIALMAVLSWAIGLILDTQVGNHQKLMELQIRKFKHDS